MPVNERETVQVGDMAATHALSGSVRRPMERELSTVSPRASEISDEMLGITFIPPLNMRDNNLPLGIEVVMAKGSYRSVEAFTPILEATSNGTSFPLSKLC